MNRPDEQASLLGTRPIEFHVHRSIESQHFDFDAAAMVKRIPASVTPEKSEQRAGAMPVVHHSWGGRMHTQPDICGGNKTCGYDLARAAPANTALVPVLTDRKSYMGYLFYCINL